MILTTNPYWQLNLKTALIFLKIIVLSSIFLQSSCSPGGYSGKLDNWSGEEADILLNTLDPIIVGKVNANGKVKFELSQAIADSIEAMFAAEQKKEDGIRFVSTTVAEAFYCTDGKAFITNGSVELMKATASGAFYIADMKEEEFYGQFRVASDTLFNNTYFELGKKDFEVGYYIDYFYVHEDASVMGVCETKSYTQDMQQTVTLVHTYNIQLNKGWNMVRTEVVETYRDGDFVRPLKYIMETVTDFPKDAKFVFTSVEQM